MINIRNPAPYQGNKEYALFTEVGMLGTGKKTDLIFVFNQLQEKGGI